MKKIQTKRLILTTLSLFLVSTFFSCQDFLEEEPLADLTVDQVYNSDADLQQAVAGIYADLSNDNVYRRGRIQFFLELRTDAMMLGGTQLEGERLEIATFNYSPSNGFITNLWDRLYNGINNANVLIEKAPAAAAASAAGKRRTVAEAHFLRAFMYFNLVRLWGAVPLVLDSPTTFNETRNATRTPVDQIYAQIIEDARTAAGEVNPDIILPEIGNNDGRLTLSAAQTLLAEVYLSLQNYAESARYAKQVIDGGTHALWPNYGDAFSIANQYRANSAPNAESVFEVKFYQEIDPGSRFATYAWPRGLVLPYAAQRSRVGEGFFEVHESSYNLMDDNDTRKNYMFPKTYTLGTGADAIAVPDEDTIKGGAYSGLAFNQEPPYFCLKYPTNTDPLLRFGWGQNPWPVYRYSDVLLMYAEAMNEQGMATQDVLDQTINQTRARGGMPPLVGLGQGEIREALKQERYIEFFFEGKRFFDLVRWGELVQTVNNRDFGYTNNFPITEEYELLPLPQRELDANPNLGVNNSPWN